MKHALQTSPVGRPWKKARRAVHGVDQSADATRPDTDHPVLRQYYPKILTLRHYLLSQLPRTSKTRRRRLAQVGAAAAPQHEHEHQHQYQHDHSPSIQALDNDLGQLLDSALVGAPADSTSEIQEQAVRERHLDIETFTQQRSQGTTGGTCQPGQLQQSEVSCLHSFEMAC